MHAKFVNFDKRVDASFDSVEFFVEKFPKVLEFIDREMNSLLEQFRDYQMMNNPSDEVMS